MSQRRAPKARRIPTCRDQAHRAKQPDGRAPAAEHAVAHRLERVDADVDTRHEIAAKLLRQRDRNCLENTGTLRGLRAHHIAENRHAANVHWDQHRVFRAAIGSVIKLIPQQVTHDANHLIAAALF
jgi:hypothetical protein